VCHDQVTEQSAENIRNIMLRKIEEKKRYDGTIIWKIDEFSKERKVNGSLSIYVR
jgi:hypothetical protein